MTNYSNCGRVDEAISLCRKYSASRQQFVITLTGVLSSGNAKKDQLEPLRKDVEDALMELPDSRRVRVAAGLYYMAMGEMETAAVHYQNVVTKTNTDLIALNNLALILSEDDGQLDSASNHIDLAIEKHGNLPALLDTRAMIHLRKDEVNVAIQQLRLAINLEMFPNPVHQFHLAASLAKAGNLEEAKAIYRVAKKQGLANRLWTKNERELSAWLEDKLK